MAFGSKATLEWTSRPGEAPVTKVRLEHHEPCRTPEFASGPEITDNSIYLFFEQAFSGNFDEAFQNRSVARCPFNERAE